MTEGKGGQDGRKGAPSLRMEGRGQGGHTDGLGKRVRRLRGRGANNVKVRRGDRLAHLEAVWT